MDRHQGQNEREQNVDYQRNQVRKTLITFDKGSTWRPIKYNGYDSNNQKVFCPDNNCSLHLHNQVWHGFGPT